VKLGRIIAPDATLWWSRSYCMLPTPDLSQAGAGGDSFRVYYGTTDDQSFGRVAWVDLDRRDPTRVVARAAQPVLDLGRPGTFDDCGVVPSCVVTDGAETRLYYVGFQRTFAVPIMLFAGLARSFDGGATFVRASSVPILDRSDAEPFTRTAPFVMREGDQHRMWYVSGEGWDKSATGKLYSRYAIRHCRSADGVDWPRSGAVCLAPDADAGEEGLARPWIVKESGRYRMWFSIRTAGPDGVVAYTSIGYAESDDGLAWRRLDQRAGLARAEAGWDSEMICYAAVVGLDDRLLALYNGNGNGKTGLGAAWL
jgi:hypothetical protein